MKRKVSAREFLHQFAQLEKGLRPGESVTITRRGEPLGKFVKEPAQAEVRLPDFAKDAARSGFDAKEGDQLLARLLNDEAIS
jgi:antitoxin (DNA-binding transcriptional repressor) of toxin-antitoxin stability system